MNVFLIIILTALVTIIASIDFHPDRHKEDIKKLGSNKKAKAIHAFIDFYPGFHLFFNLLSLLSVIWIACLAALTWGMLAGCFVALVVIALAQLLGARLVSLTDELIINQANLLVKYFSWTTLLSSLVTTGQSDPIADVDELIVALRHSRIDCPTQLVIEKTIQLQNMPAEKLATKWSEVKKVSYKDKLTPMRIDELFQSGQKIFPVVRNDDDDVVGLLHLSDVSTIGQTEKKLLASMHRNFATCEYGTTVPDAVKLMADNETTVVVIVRNKKVYGLINLGDVVESALVCTATPTN